MNYKKMSDFEINKEVAEIVTDGYVVPYSEMARGTSDNCVQVIYKVGIHGEYLDYCNDPSQAWPIIVDNKIQLSPLHSSGINKDIWIASDGFMPPESQYLDKNPLRAAMICFLKMKAQEEK